MARTLRNSKIDTRSGRAKLPVKKTVHWVAITRGFSLGYRKGAKGGVWLAKLVGDDARNETTLGPADDFLDANGTSILDYAQAQEAARTWLKALERAHDGERTSLAFTVRNALDDYLKEYKRRGGKAANTVKTSVDSQIAPALGKLLIAKLTKQRIRDWHADFAEVGARLRTKKDKEQKFRDYDPSNSESVRRRRASANRLLSVLKAALNFGVAEGKIESDAAWRYVKPFKNVDIPKVRYLSIKQCETLVEEIETDFRPMCQAALLTGCRYGELGAVACDDFDADNTTLFIRQSKSGKARHVVLTDDGVAFFRSIVGQRPGDELIFKRPDGKAWGKSHQHRHMKDACKAAAIVPAISFHVLRHTYASHLVMSGASLQVVAANLGHADTRVTERHYAHLAPSHVASVIRSSLPKMNILDRTRLKVVA